jgi:hypothetical protein
MGPLVLENSPDRCGACCPLGNSERAGPIENPPPPAIYVALDQKLTGIFDWRRTELVTTAWQDFSHPQGIYNSSKTELKGGGSAGDAAAGILTKIHQNGIKTSFFEVMSEVQKDPEDISAGIGQKKLLSTQYVFLQFEFKVGEVNFGLAQSN